MDHNKALGMARRISKKDPSYQLQSLFQDRKEDYFQLQETLDRKDDKQMHFESIQMVDLKYKREKVYKESLQYRQKHIPCLATAQVISSMPMEKRHRICHQIMLYLIHKERLALSL